MSFGQAHVFYPEVGEDRTTAALLLDVDPVGMVRGKSRDQSFLLGHYVNDRPYVASSFMSVAISQVFGSAMAGRCKDRPELAATPIPLSARIEVLPVRGGEDFCTGVSSRWATRSKRPASARRAVSRVGRKPLFLGDVHRTKTLSELLTHLYVLIPVFDNKALFRRRR